jgi:hypothetical protein
VYACMAGSFTGVLSSFLMRSLVNTIVPFEVVFASFLSLIGGDILYGMIKFIPVKNKQTGQYKRWAIGMILSFLVLHHTRTNTFT